MFIYIGFCSKLKTLGVYNAEVPSKCKIWAIILPEMPSYWNLWGGNRDLSMTRRHVSKFWTKSRALYLPPRKYFLLVKATTVRSRAVNHAVYGSGCPNDGCLGDWTRAVPSKSKIPTVQRRVGHGRTRPYIMVAEVIDDVEGYPCSDVSSRAQHVAQPMFDGWRGAVDRFR